MKSTLTRKQECRIALAMGQQRSFNPAVNLNAKSGKKQAGQRTQPVGYRGFFGRLW